MVNEKLSVDVCWLLWGLSELGWKILRKKSVEEVNLELGSVFLVFFFKFTFPSFRVAG